MINRPNIAVVGASGAVGEAMLSILAERGHREDRVTALASARSAGNEVEFGAASLTIEDLATYDFSSTDYALFSAGGSVSKEHAPRAAESGAVVIDNTSAFRYDDDKLLVVPEVNGELLDAVKWRLHYRQSQLFHHSDGGRAGAHPPRRRHHAD